MHVLAQVTPELARTGLPLKQVEDMAQGMFGRMAQGVTALEIGQELLGDFATAGDRARIAKYHLVGIGQEIRVLVGLAPNHDTVHFAHVIMNFLQGFHSAVKDDLHVCKCLLDCVGTLVNEWGNLAVFLGRKSGEYGLAGMNGEAGAAGPLNLLHKSEQEVVIVLVVDADAGLYRDRYGNDSLHGFHAFTHQLRFGHEDGADLALLNPI